MRSATATSAMRACTAGLEEALDGLERELRCPICLSWLERPKMLDVCKHLFCAGCLDQHFATEGGRKGCPVCGEAATRRSAMDDEFTATLVAAAKSTCDGLRAGVPLVVTKPPPPPPPGWSPKTSNPESTTTPPTRAVGPAGTPEERPLASHTLPAVPTGSERAVVLDQLPAASVAAAPRVAAFSWADFHQLDAESRLIRGRMRECIKQGASTAPSEWAEILPAAQDLLARMRDYRDEAAIRDPVNDLHVVLHEQFEGSIGRFVTAMTAVDAEGAPASEAGDAPASKRARRVGAGSVVAGATVVADAAAPPERAAASSSSGGVRGAC